MSANPPRSSPIIEDGDSDDEMTQKKSQPASRFQHTANMTPEEAKATRDAGFAAAGKQAPEPVKVMTEEEKAAKEKEKEEAEASKAKAAARASADKEKTQGNDAYKARNFPTAIQHYQAALKIDPTNITYYNNLSAVYVETKEYQKAIDTALTGVEQGKAHQAPYVDVAKAFTRIGGAYQSLNQLDKAIEFYNKSLLEDYNDKTKAALKKIEEQFKKNEELAYINPEKSEEAKLRGNELYGAGKYAEAIGEYSEAIKRNPENYKVYSNRAACYSKLMEWNRGLADCEICLQKDPKFVKAYIRKGKIQHFLKQYHKALSTFDQALVVEPSNTEVMEAKRATMIAIQSSEGDPERAKQAMQDPEIQAILRDPTISKVLQDMQQSPQAGASAMRDPDIRKKIEKLIAAGVLGVK